MDTYTQTINAILCEDIKSALAAGALGLSSLGATPTSDADINVSSPPVAPITQEQSEDSKFSVVNPTSPNVPQNSKDWSGIVIHHTESPHGAAKDIDRWHKERGFDEIGYNYVVQKNGTVEKGRSLTKSGAHAKSGKPQSRNSSHIGIVLVKKEGESPTPAQSRAMGTLIRSLVDKFDIQTIERHHERCPGHEVKVDVLNKTLQQLRKENPK